MDTLPSFDLYQTLGVSKSANLSEIRSAYRKLILKCHPDKVLDESLKLIKQAEFQKVQEAYEILSDGNRKREYDDLLNKIEMRRKMSQGKPTPRSNPFEYEIKTPSTPPNPFGPDFAYMYKDVPYHTTERANTAQKTSSQGNSFSPEPDLRRAARSQDLKREALRKKLKEEEARRIRLKEAEASRKQKEEEIRRKKKDLALKQKKLEEEAKRKREKKKETQKKEKIKKRDVDDGRSRKTSVRVENALDDQYSTPKSTDNKSSQSKSEPHQSASNSARKAPMNRKWNGHHDYAGAYLHASRQQSATPETSKTTSPSSNPNLRNNKIPEHQDRKSKGENTPQKSHDSPSPSAPSTPLPKRKPALKTQKSAPPFFQLIAGRKKPRESPSRSRAPPPPPPPPPLSRSKTHSASRNSVVADLFTFSSLSIQNNSFSLSPKISSQSFSSAYYSRQTQTSPRGLCDRKTSVGDVNTSKDIHKASFENVKFSPNYGHENVTFASHSVQYTKLDIS